VRFFKNTFSNPKKSGIVILCWRDFGAIRFPLIKCDENLLQSAARGRARKKLHKD
jgi:hypothetical protein